LLNLSILLSLLKSPAKTTTLHLPSAGNALTNCIAFASQNLTTCALGNLIPTTKPLANSCLLLAAEVMIESSYLAVRPAVYFPPLMNCSLK
jgi:hypothetical protein